MCPSSRRSVWKAGVLKVQNADRQRKCLERKVEAEETIRQEMTGSGPISYWTDWKMGTGVQGWGRSGDGKWWEHRRY